MNIVYASCACSKRTFFDLFINSQEMPGQQVQKYHRLMLRGLAKNGARVTTLTALPVSRTNVNKTFVKVEPDRESDVRFKYLTAINIPGIKNLVDLMGGFLSACASLRSDNNAVIVCDVLNVSVSTGGLFAAKVFQARNVGIVTDIPHLLNPTPRSIRNSLAEIALRQFDSYVFLTEDMNRLVNSRAVPYVVIEGQVDTEMKHYENHLAGKYSSKVCLYAGAIDRRYGISSLVDGFIAARAAESELHVYGRGDFEEDLKAICAQYSNIKYYGLVPNDVVVQAQLRATLLVNPRPTNEEYTKYSFPSKNMEYLASGTPLVTTNLPGMPTEYLPHVYIFEDESSDGIAASLQELLSLPVTELHRAGLAARNFVLEDKNNVAQARRILDLIASTGKKAQ